MKKRIFSLLLVIAMIAAILPMISTTASALDYTSGTQTLFSDLKKGDTIRAGANLKTDYQGTTYILSTNTPTSTSNYKTLKKLSGLGKVWTADKNYYVVLADHFFTDYYLYPIPETYITFDPNGGTAGGTTSNSKFQTVRFTGDYCDVSWLSPSRPGYTFKGWYIGNTQIYNANGITVNDGTIWSGGVWQYNGSATVTAKWEIANFTSRVDANGGYRASDGSTDVILFDRKYRETEPISERRRAGYILSGYKVTNSNNGSTTDIGGAVITFDNSTKTATFTQGTVPITLIAQWTPINYTVIFNGNGATGSTASQGFTYDQAKNLNSNAFQKKYTVTFDLNDGSTATSGVAPSIFKGWNTAANGSGTSYSNGQSVKNLTTTNNGSVTLYAQWQNGSITLPTPTKLGKVCTGWYTSTGEKVGNCGASYTPSGNVTIYAHWETVGYTVIWKNYDGSILETDVGHELGDNPTYNGATPQKPDTVEKSFIFSGWTPAISPITGDIEYTAQFTETPRKYDLTFVFDETMGELVGDSKAPVGSVVTVNVLPNNGYEVKEIIAYKTGDRSTAVSIDSTSYRFTMPAFDVTIEVTWKESDVIFTSAYKDVAPTYTVTIPATVTLGETVTISADNVVIPKGKQVEVSLSNACGFKLTNAQGATLSYTVKNGDTIVGEGEIVLVVNPTDSKDGSVSLAFTASEAVRFAGAYTGTVTFTIAIESD